MGEYEDRYPEAYGHDEAGAARPAPRRPFLHFGLARPSPDASTAGAAAADEGRRFDPPRAPVDGVASRTPRQICDEVWERLKREPSVDLSGITVTVSGSNVALDGTVDSAAALTAAQTATAAVAGVGRVQVGLRVV